MVWSWGSKVVKRNGPKSSVNTALPALMDGEAGAKALNASRMGRSEVEMAPEIAAAWDKVISNENSWIAIGYTGKKQLALLGSGDEPKGYAGLRPLLADDAVVYGVFRCRAPETLVFVASIGENAGGMVKGRATAHTQSVEGEFTGVHGRETRGTCARLRRCRTRACVCAIVLRWLPGTKAALQLADANDYESDAVAAKLAKALNCAVEL